MRNGSFTLDLDPPQPLVAALCYRGDDREFYSELKHRISSDISGVISKLEWPTSDERPSPVGTLTFETQGSIDCMTTLNKVCSALEASGFRRIRTY